VICHAAGITIIVPLGGLGLLLIGVFVLLFDG
jgi:hypothetical protein